MMADQVTSTNSRAKKRRLDDWQNDNVDLAEDEGAPIGASSTINRTRLSHLDYTIGWICALEMELSAARLMLDEEHLPLPVPSHDDNCYVLGKIGEHNIVIACLPAGVYGKSSAALVAKSMMSTFTEIDAYVLVGIGGGVPHSSNDIRLGDIVVGVPTSETPAVIQYDFGKTGTKGFEHKGSLDKPRTSLLTAVSRLRSSLCLTPNRLSDSMMVVLRKYPSAQRFSYPDTAADILWEQDCEHYLHREACRCENIRPAVRQARDDMMPRIFYGPIGSGDQVIKDYYTRDTLARQHGILCFEMEAAGLMDQLHALVVRGICDYCDAMKNKDFQPYAALSAAAYTKELLLEIPVRLTRSYHQTIGVPDEITKIREKNMAALKFDASDNRRLNVKKAHSQTCNWLFEQQEYIDWIDPKQVGSTFLWIKGKPGTGKSTVMKVLHENIVKDVKTKRNDDIVIAFFFDARGSELQKSTLGLYRSLIFQLMSHAQDMKHLLDKLYIDSNFSLNALIDLFTDSVHELGSRQLICCIDALDECSEDQVREMVEAFEDLAKSIEDCRTRLRVAFSSRHYPNIEMKDAKYLVLEALPGHSTDIEKYIQSELRIGTDTQAKDLERQIFKKSSGIFLWVVLVVSILNKTYARGRIHELSKRLAETPTGLNELFHDILFRDTENPSDLLLCLQWLLYARRPLTCEELYSAILLPTDDTQFKQCSANITVKQMAGLILDSCKGLVEFTEYTEYVKPEVRFIHESVREFLLTPGVLSNLHCSFESFSAGASHEQLRDTCYWQLSHTAKYITSHHIRGMTVSKWDWRQIILREFPLAEYAMNHVLYHAEHAPHKSHIPFLQKFDTDLWGFVYLSISALDAWELELERASCKLDHHLVKINAFSLLEAWWSITPINNQDLVEIGVWMVLNKDLHECKAILRAYYRSTLTGLVSLEHIDPLLKVLGDLVDCDLLTSSPFRDFFLLIVYWYHKKDPTELNKAIYTAICCKRKAAIRLLIAEGSVLRNEDIPTLVCQETDESSIYGDLCIWLGNDRHHMRHNEDDYLGEPPSTELLTDTLACVVFLFDQPSVMNMSNRQISTILHHAIEWTNSTIVASLLDIFAKWPHASLSLELALEWAVSCGKAQTAQLLLKRGALPGRNLMRSASRPAMIQCLIQNGIDIEWSDDQGNTALHLAISRGAIDTVMLLISQGAKINTRNYLGETPLHYAVKEQREDIVVRLLRNGAQVDAVDKEGNTCLHVAAYSGQTGNIKLLVHHSADINRENNQGRTPFQEVFSHAGPAQSGIPRAASVLYDHGAKAIPPSQELIPSSVSASSIIRMNFPKPHKGNKVCCELAGLSAEQIYFKSTYLFVVNGLNIRG